MSDCAITPNQLTELCRLLHHVLVQIRFYGYYDKTAQMTDLADVFHNVPKQMAGDQEMDWDFLRSSLERYENVFKGELSGINLIAEIDRIRKLEQCGPDNSRSFGTSGMSDAGASAPPEASGSI